MADRKRCSVCKAVKPLEAFNRNRRVPDGYHYQCRDCHRAQVSTSAKRAAEQKYCPSCAETKLRREFHQNRTQPDGLQTQCKACHVTQVQRYRARLAGCEMPSMPTRTRAYKHVAKVRPAPPAEIEIPCVGLDIELPAGLVPAPPPKAARGCGCGTHRGAACGFPDQDFTCGYRVCVDHGHQIRHGLVYCQPHYERAQEALARRNSGR